MSASLWNVLFCGSLWRAWILSVCAVQRFQQLCLEAVMVARFTVLVACAGCECGRGRAGCVGAKSVPGDGVVCGLLMQNQLDRPLEEATLTYKLKFSENYDWTAGAASCCLH